MSHTHTITTLHNTNLLCNTIISISISHPTLYPLYHISHFIIITYLLKFYLNSFVQLLQSYVAIVVFIYLASSSSRRQFLLARRMIHLKPSTSNVFSYLTYAHTFTLSSPQLYRGVSSTMQTMYTHWYIHNGLIRICINYPSHQW